MARVKLQQPPDVVAEMATSAVEDELRQRPNFPKAFPKQAMEEIIDILGNEKWFDRKAELARAMWELQGRAMGSTFGRPECPGYEYPEIDNTEMQVTMRLLDAKLRTCLLILKAPDTVTGANVKLLDLNEMIVIVECCIRITRLLIGTTSMRAQTQPQAGMSPDAC